MSRSLSLLEQPHSIASRTIIQEAVKPNVNIDYLVAGHADVRSDGDVNQTVFIDTDAYNDPTWPYRGSVDLRYKRVDLQTALGHLGLRFYAGSTYRSEDLVTHLANVLNLSFESSDFIHESIPMSTTGRTVALLAANDSLRWKGQVNVFVYR